MSEESGGTSGGHQALELDCDLPIHASMNISVSNKVQYCRFHSNWHLFIVTYRLLPTLKAI